MLKTWLREPLTLFVALGIALFAADRVWNGAPLPSGEATHIVVSATQQANLRDAFREQNGRNPTTAELHAALGRWIEEQVLYHEALALNLDRKNPIVRRELSQKMRFLLDDAAALPAPSDTQLQAWLEQHMARYGKPSSLSFQQVFLSRGRHGERLLADAARIAQALAVQPEQYRGFGDPFPLGQDIRDANPAQLRRDFGAAFAQTVPTLPPHQWSAPIASGFGLHLVRITELRGFQPVRLAEVRQQVFDDYRLEQRERATQQAIEKLEKKYRIEFEALPS